MWLRKLRWRAEGAKAMGFGESEAKMQNACCFGGMGCVSMQP